MEAVRSGIRMGGRFEIECWRPTGRLAAHPRLAQFMFAHGMRKFHELAWKDDAKNLTVNVGIQNVLDAAILGGTPVDPWYGLLTDGTPTVAAADTLATHAGWVEIADYAGSRKEYVGVRSAQSITNAASVMAFAIDATVTVGGCGLASVATTTSGVLLCAAAFTVGDRDAVDGDTINVTYVFAGTDDGA